MTDGIGLLLFAAGALAALNGAIFGFYLLSTTPEAIARREMKMLAREALRALPARTTRI